MPTGIYLRTDYHKKRLSETHKGLTPWNKNKSCSKKTRQKISKSLLGKKKKPFSEQHRKKLSLAHLGKKLPPFTEEHKRKIGIGNKKYIREKSHKWKGGKIENNGYVFIYAPDHPFKNGRGYVREHRLVIEKFIGRYLLPQETIHHLGKRNDNRLSMLMCFINRAIHQKFEHGKEVKPYQIIFDGHHLNSSS